MTSAGQLWFNGNLSKILTTAMTIIASGKLNLKDMITHRYALEDVAKAFKDVESGMVVKGVFDFK